MRTIVFEIPSGAIRDDRATEVLITIWGPEDKYEEANPPTLALRQPTPTSSGTWGIPHDAVRDVDEGAADRYMKAITGLDPRARDRLVEGLQGGTGYDALEALQAAEEYLRGVWPETGEVS